MRLSLARASFHVRSLSSPYPAAVAAVSSGPFISRCLSTATAASSSADAGSESTSQSSDSNTSDQIRTQSEGDVRKSTSTAKTPFFFQTGVALFAKRRSKPLPPPFYTPPTTSFSDALSTRNRRPELQAKVNGQLIRGFTNGDDAVLAEENFIGANDGVGAWSAKPRGHAALWSRLVLHFWSLQTTQALEKGEADLDPIKYLQTAYEETIEATTKQSEWFGTTTASGAILYHKDDKPLLYVTNLGDSQVLVIRPKKEEIIYKTSEQWHWFDCPRQLGTNSPDTPVGNAVCDSVEIEVDDIVLAMSDGVPDNLWDHEILSFVMASLKEYESSGEQADGLMTFIARRIVKEAKVIAQDPFAESPFMERAVEEGLAMEGGKPDDISVVAGMCQRREQ